VLSEPIRKKNSFIFMKIRDAAKLVLGQLSEVIAQLNKNEYCLPILQLGNSSLGQHFRHTIEFFLCLKDGTSKGTINYDKRHRDQDLEENPETALQTINKIIRFIDSVDPTISLNLKVDYSDDGQDEQVILSNFRRELAYNVEHAVHHMAILKIGLSQVSPKTQIPEGFGIAVSTLRYRKALAQHA
jgi:hypothetical protein